MDPEQLAQFLEDVQVLRDAGTSDREINSMLRRNRDVPFNSIAQLEAEAQFAARNTPRAPDLEGRAAAPSDAGIPTRPDAPQVEPAPLGDRIRGQITNAADKFFAGFGTDAVGLVSPEAKDRLDQQIAVAKRDAPVTTGATGLATSLIPAAGVGRLFGLGKGGLQNIGRGQGILARGATGAGQVGAAGAAEAGLFAAGLEEGTPSERLAAAGRAAPFGAGAGVVTGGLLGTASGAQQARRAVQESGGLLAERGARTAGLRPRSAPMRGEIADVGRQARGLLRPLEEGTEALPPSVTQEFVNSPLMRRELRRIGTPEARAVAEQLENVAAGKPGDLSGLTFQMADDVRSGLRHEADIFAGRKPDARGRRPSNVRQQAIEGEFNLLDRALRESPTFDRSRRLFAQEGTSRRALEAGETAFRQKADDFVREFDNLPGGAPAQRAFRQGAIGELTAQLNTGDAVESFLRRASAPGSEVQQKLRVIMGGEEALQDFLSAVAREKGVLKKARLIEMITKGAGFLFGGTSIAGGAGLIATQ